MTEIGSFTPEEIAQTGLGVQREVSVATIREKRPHNQIPEESLEYFRGLTGTTTLEQMHQYQIWYSLLDSSAAQMARAQLPQEWERAVSSMDRRAKQRLTMALRALKEDVADIDQLRSMQPPCHAKRSFKFYAKFFNRSLQDNPIIG